MSSAFVANPPGSIAELIKKGAIAESDGMTVHLSHHSLTGQGLKGLGILRADAFFLRSGNDRRCKGMFAPALDA